MIWILFLFFLVSGSHGGMCPICNRAKRIDNCALYECDPPLVCEIEVANSRINSRCVDKQECDKGSEKSCVFHQGFFEYQDKCKECSDRANYSNQVFQFIEPRLTLSCPQCTAATDPWVCLRNITRCDPGMDMCKLSTNGIHFTSTCTSTTHCHGELASVSGGGCTSQRGNSEDCVACCDDLECFEETFHVPFGSITTFGFGTTIPSTLVAMNEKPCRDERFPCSKFFCADKDLSQQMCPLTCGLCVPDSSTTNMLTTDVYTPPPYKGVCKDEISTCDQSFCDQVDVAEVLCAFTCNLCIPTSSPDSSTTNMLTTDVYTPPPYKGVCKDEISTCDQSFCDQVDVAEVLCALTCNLCIPTTSPDSSTTNMLTTDVYTPPPYKGECKDEISTCDQSFCDQVDVAEVLCALTCNLCISTSSPDSSTTNVLTTDVYTPPPYKGVCKDEISTCDQSFCDQVDVAEVLCALTCNLCISTSSPVPFVASTKELTLPPFFGECKDEIDACSQAMCDEGDLGQAICPRFCGVCTPDSTKGVTTPGIQQSSSSVGSPSTTLGFASSTGGSMTSTTTKQALVSTASPYILDSTIEQSTIGRPSSHIDATTKGLTTEQFTQTSSIDIVTSDVTDSATASSAMTDLTATTEATPSTTSTIGTTSATVTIQTTTTSKATTSIKSNIGTSTTFETLTPDAKTSITSTNGTTSTTFETTSTSEAKTSIKSNIGTSATFETTTPDAKTSITSTNETTSTTFETTSTSEAKTSIKFNIGTSATFEATTPDAKTSITSTNETTSTTFETTSTSEAKTSIKSNIGTSTTFETTTPDAKTSITSTNGTTPTTFETTSTSEAKTSIKSNIGTSTTFETTTPDAKTLITSTNETTSTTSTTSTSEAKTSIKSNIGTPTTFETTTPDAKTSITSTNEISTTVETTPTSEATPSITPTIGTTSTTDETTLAATIQPQVKRRCHVCGDHSKLSDEGKFCEGLDTIFPPKQDCPGSNSYCMTDVYLSVTENPKFIRRCATGTQCHKDWWESTSDVSTCVDSGDVTRVHADITCSYCCTEDYCNSGTMPAKETLYTE